MNRMPSTSNVLFLVLSLAHQKLDSDAAAIPESESLENKTLTIGVLTSYELWSYRYLPAIIPALKMVDELQLLPGYKIDWTWRETGCLPVVGFRAAISLWEDVEDLDAVLGADCSSVCQNIALLTDAWNIPTVSYACMSSTLSDVSQYPTFARTIQTELGWAGAPLYIMQAFRWERCAIVATSQNMQSSWAKASKRALEAAGITVFFHITNQVIFGEEVDPDAITEMRNVVRTIKNEARFIINYMTMRDRRVFLILAHDEGLLSEEYIHFGDTVDVNIETSLYRPEVDIYELLVGVLALDLAPPPSVRWHQFLQDVMEAYSDPHFDGHQHVESVDDILGYADNVHDAVLLWAYAVNRTLEEGGLPDDGVTVTQNMYNFTFDGIIGPVTIDHKGDRQVGFFISIWQPGHQFTPLFYWHAENDWLEKIYRPNSTDDWSGLYWSGNSTTIPAGIPACGWELEFCEDEDGGGSTIIIIVACLGLAIIGFLLVAVYAYKWRLNQQMKSELKQCLFDISDIKLLRSKRMEIQNDMHDIHLEEATNPDMGGIPLTFSNSDIVLVPGRSPHGLIGEMEASVRVYIKLMTHSEKSRLFQEIILMKHTAHINLNKFTGVCLAPPKVIILMEHAAKGSLYDLISSQAVTLTRDLQNSFLADISRGLRHLHSRLQMCHGHLTSTSCMIDGRWVCKISDYGFPDIRLRGTAYNTMPDEGKLWTAPEILRQESNASKEGDVFSFGIIIQEVITKSRPFDRNIPRLTTSEIITKVQSGCDEPYRPYLGADTHATEWTDLAWMCWDEDPMLRPSARRILFYIAKQNNGELPNLVESMIKNLEHHTHILEGIVDKRSIEVKNEQAVMDRLLRELLPESVVDELKTKQQVKPQTFDKVTFFFSDIVGFTKVSAMSNPMQVVKMLNILYSQFDSVISGYDVYKVATIGDAYVVSSGAPKRNGDQHASEIAAMAIDMLDVVKEFSIPHLSDEHLYMRIGLHTGPCVAAVTGIKTPRYLFFGETVDVAARIEAGGEKMKIHISFTTANILREIGGFEMEYHGKMEIEGIGVIDTYWLISQKRSLSTVSLVRS